MTRSTPWLLACIAVIALCSVALATPVAADAATTTTTPASPATVGNSTSVGTAESFGGFTLGAGVLAVLVGGAYWYYRR